MVEEADARERDRGRGAPLRGGAHVRGRRGRRRGGDGPPAAGASTSRPRRRSGRCCARCGCTRSRRAAPGRAIDLLDVEMAAAGDRSPRGPTSRSRRPTCSRTACWRARAGRARSLEEALALVPGPPAALLALEESAESRARRRRRCCSRCSSGGWRRAASRGGARAAALPAGAARRGRPGAGGRGAGAVARALDEDARARARRRWRGRAPRRVAARLGKDAELGARRRARGRGGGRAPSGRPGWRWAAALARHRLGAAARAPS